MANLSFQQTVTQLQRTGHLSLMSQTKNDFGNQDTLNNSDMVNNSKILNCNPVVDGKVTLYQNGSGKPINYKLKTLYTQDSQLALKSIENTTNSPIQLIKNQLKIEAQKYDFKVKKTAKKCGNSKVQEVADSTVISGVKMKVKEMEKLNLVGGGHDLVVAGSTASAGCRVQTRDFVRDGVEQAKVGATLRKQTLYQEVAGVPVLYGKVVSKILDPKDIVFEQTKQSLKAGNQTIYNSGLTQTRFNSDLTQQNQTNNQLQFWDQKDKVNKNGSSSLPKMKSYSQKRPAEVSY